LIAATTAKRRLDLLQTLGRLQASWLVAICVGMADGQEPAASAGQRIDPSTAQGPDRQEPDRQEPDADWALHVQSTVVYQYHPAFTSPFEGTHSLTPDAEGKHTFDLTLYGGVRPWQGAEFWLNPEVDQGFGLSNTLGVAGYPSGEAYKVGAEAPYVRLHRAFLRQTIDLDGEVAQVPADLNRLALRQSADRVVITAGKFSVVDVFDNNAYAHDPRTDFLNWSIIESGAFDYAADAWGYTYGLSGEWYQGENVLRLGLFDLSTVPNSKTLDSNLLRQYEVVGEWERRCNLGGRPGAARLLGFAMHGDLGEYDEASSIAESTGRPADIAAVRREHTKFGAALNLQQEVADDAGLFLRLSGNQGQFEAFDFTDVHRSLAFGTSVGGSRWNRPADRLGVACAVNRASTEAERFFDAGGLGILIGDGRLPRPGSERIVETYYSLALAAGAFVSLDYQFIDDPAYNRDRGPVSVLGARFHVQF
jgi:high affinity Mn2+ porin